MYLKPCLTSYSAEEMFERIGPVQTQYTGTLTIYGVKSAMYSPAEQGNSSLRLVKLDEVKDKIA